MRLVYLAQLSILSLVLAGCGGGEFPDCTEDNVPGAECFDGNNVSGDGCSADCKIEHTCGDGHVVPGEECDDGNTAGGDGCTADCHVEGGNCGNGVLEAGEECDDSNTTSGDGCDNLCNLEEPPTCGNGTVEAGEDCDDSNTDSGDGCSADCQVEHVCGDGTLDAGEECDDGNTDNGDRCDATCHIEHTCGDGTTDAGEDCDDGNNDNGDGCSALCQTEHTCGDGNVNPGEQCDDGNDETTDGCVLCQVAFCGDGSVQAGVEQCDDGNADNTDGCTNLCKTAVCGDGFVQAGAEQCDDGNTSNNDACLNTCNTATCGDTFVWTGVEQCDSTPGCRDTCQLGTCGDTITDPGEECDDGNTDNSDACLSSCKTAKCGDGIVQAGVETCDDGNASNNDACLNTCLPASCGDGFVQTGVETCDLGAGNSDTGACPTTCQAARCGDGLKRADITDPTDPAYEACDDGNTENADACLNTCKLAGCGDGIAGPGEICDDGNQSNTDACLTTCVAASCGDGFVRVASEDCDDGNADNTDGCAQCHVARCGDGFVEAGVEACDDGNTDNTDGCLTTTCAVASCGDGFVEAGVEQCDLGVSNSDTGSCTTQCKNAACGDGFTQASNAEECDEGAANNNTGSCTVACKDPKCGDGFVQASNGEECDLGTMNSNQGGCLLSCKVASCGDGFIETGVEECDFVASNEQSPIFGAGVSCTTQGFTGGQLLCVSPFAHAIVGGGKPGVPRSFPVACTLENGCCYRTPGAGDIAITEVMREPALCDDDDVCEHSLGESNCNCESDCLDPMDPNDPNNPLCRTGNASFPGCGNNTCDAGESCYNCPKDCGHCGEWLEIHNQSPYTQDLSAVTVSAGSTSFIVSNGTRLPPDLDVQSDELSDHLVFDNCPALTHGYFVFENTASRVASVDYTYNGSIRLDPNEFFDANNPDGRFDPNEPSLLVSLSKAATTINSVNFNEAFGFGHLQPDFPSNPDGFSLNLSYSHYFETTISSNDPNDWCNASLNEADLINPDTLEFGTPGAANRECYIMTVNNPGGGDVYAVIPDFGSFAFNNVAFFPQYRLFGIYLCDPTDPNDAGGVCSASYADQTYVFLLANDGERHTTDPNTPASFFGWETSDETLADPNCVGHYDDPNNVVTPGVAVTCAVQVIGTGSVTSVYTYPFSVFSGSDCDGDIIVLEGTNGEGDPLTCTWPTRSCSDIPLRVGTTITATAIAFDDVNDPFNYWIGGTDRTDGILASCVDSTDPVCTANNLNGPGDAEAFFDCD